MATKSTTAPKKAAAKGQTDWSVIDLNVNNPKHVGLTRTHDVLDADGKTHHAYALPGSVDKATKQGCPMPPDHALKFLGDPSFQVFDSDGKLVQPLRPQTSSQGLTLQRHETVATFQELTRDALMNRVRRLPGGPLVPGNTTNAKLIELLMTGGAPGTQRVQPESEDDLGSVGEGDDDTDMDMEGGDLAPSNLPIGLAARKAEIQAQMNGGGTPAPAPAPTTVPTFEQVNLGGMD